ncbi:MAG: ATP-dependent DNA helicase RecG, partial [Candidatus Accumulibacter sp.]|nr:ATP-dependent DNA helicase RecG [Accumulibacter sp.]
MAAADTIEAPAALLARLKKIGLIGANDLVLHLPLRYEDETRVTEIARAGRGEAVQLEVTVGEIAVQFRPRRQLLVQVADGSGELTLRFLNFYGSQTRQFERARDEKLKLRVFGEIREGFLGAEMVHPRYRPVGKEEVLPQALTPVYPTTAGVSQVVLRRLIGAALARVDLAESLDEAWREKHGFLSFAAAVRLLHAPPPGVPENSLQTRSHPAWRRIKFDELLAQQLSLRRAYLSRRRRGAPSIDPPGVLARRLRESLPFALTSAQRRVAAEIVHDLAQPYPMQRLLQGDVGSGKTIVAALAACQAIEAGYQAAFMAPTEILAEQHYEKLRAWLIPLGVEVAWLSGGQKRAAKRAARRKAADAAGLVVGTHALIQEEVDFARLGLAIVDEQHRFGVAQRLELARKGGRETNRPHQLMMSATPIPRTLAMSYYADLDVSVLDELPPGRTPVRTRLISEARRGEVIARIR